MILLPLIQRTNLYFAAITITCYFLLNLLLCLFFFIKSQAIFFIITIMVYHRTLIRIIPINVQCIPIIKIIVIKAFIIIMVLCNPNYYNYTPLSILQIHPIVNITD